MQVEQRQHSATVICNNNNNNNQKMAILLHITLSVSRFTPVRQARELAARPATRLR
ncbi:conserved hypothetical protein [Coccidioides posadasii str. Silveira]|uniref:Uncharacterized protein n=1 Tax=Coccidioides posadasii (strain RMSCC 757 / Silveira) TaxID=443226 RepID=E9CXC9_COCPS|nr:conserved hypothetical protein [Coccidioides posadasii str. Silveira]